MTAFDDPELIFFMDETDLGMRARARITVRQVPPQLYFALFSKPTYHFPTFVGVNLW